LALGLSAPAPEPALPEPALTTDPAVRLAQLLGRDVDEVRPPVPMSFKHVEVIEGPVEPPAEAPTAPEPEAPPAAPLMLAPPPLIVPEPPPLPANLDDVPLAVPVELPARPAAGGPVGENNVGAPSRPPAAPASGPGGAVPEVPAPVPFPGAVSANVSAPAVVKTGHAVLVELWDQECRSARRKLEPEGALTGATRELQSGLGALLSVCHEHGVKVGPWRLQHVVNEWSYGDHPTYGVVTIAHWACKDAQPWRMGLGLFLARGAGKPKDLEVKLAVLETEPAMVDLLVLLRPEDDFATTGKSKSLLQESERRGKHTRLEPISLDGFAQLYAFPRWLAAVREGLPAGFPMPNLADVIQEKCEKLLEQVCMPVQ
jgi:hypothetical protein